MWGSMISLNWSARISACARSSFARRPRPANTRRGRKKAGPLIPCPPRVDSSSSARLHDDLAGHMRMERTEIGVVARPGKGEAELVVGVERGRMEALVIGGDGMRVLV